jgi:hypothetical protein
MQVKKLGHLILCIVVLLLMHSCWVDRFNTIQPPSLVNVKPATNLIIPEQFNEIKTKHLFELISDKKIGDVSGLVELRKEGILIHPGVNSPTEVSFQLSKNYHELTLSLFIATLPPEAKDIKEAGTANIEFFADKKSLGKLTVNRNAIITKTLDLSSVGTLSVRVDNQDGKAWFDWLMLRVMS